MGGYSSCPWRMFRSIFHPKSCSAESAVMSRPVGPQLTQVWVFNSISSRLWGSVCWGHHSDAYRGSHVWARGAEVPQRPRLVPGESAHFAPGVSRHPSRKRRHHVMVSKGCLLPPPEDMASQVSLWLGVTVPLSPSLLLSPAILSSGKVVWGRSGDSGDLQACPLSELSLREASGGAHHSVPTSRGSWADVRMAVLLEPKVSGSFSCHNL